MRLTPLLLLFFACTTQAAAPKPVVAEAPTFKTELEANAKQLALRILDAMPAVSVRNAAVARLNSLETLSAKCETDFHAIKGRNAAHAPTSCQGLENAVTDVLEQFRQEYLAATFNAINVEKTNQFLRNQNDQTQAALAAFVLGGISNVYMELAKDLIYSFHLAQFAAKQTCAISTELAPANCLTANTIIFLDKQISIRLDDQKKAFIEATSEIIESLYRAIPQMTPAAQGNAIPI